MLHIVKLLVCLDYNRWIINFYFVHTEVDGKIVNKMANSIFVLNHKSRLVIINVLKGEA